jgi:hypothetical protein
VFCAPWQATQVTEFAVLSEASRTQPDADLGALDELRRSLLAAAAAHLGSIGAPSAPAVRPAAPKAVKLLPEFRPGKSRPVWPPETESECGAPPAAAPPAPPPEQRSGRAAFTVRARGRPRRRPGRRERPHDGEREGGETPNDARTHMPTAPPPTQAG